MRYSVVLPAFNERAGIERSLVETIAALNASIRDFEIIVVDDGSSDDTALVAAAVALRFPQVTVLRIEENRGKGNALMCGAMHARGDFVAFLDADLDLHPRQLGGFFAKLQNEEVDAVVGSKNHPASTVSGYPALRKLYSKVYYMLVKALFGLPIRDTQTGIKVFRRALLQEVIPRLIIKRFAFDMELLAVAHRKGFEIIDAPVVVNFGRSVSRVNFRDALMTLRDTLNLFFRANVLRYYDGPLQATSLLPEYQPALEEDLQSAEIA